MLEKKNHAAHKGPIFRKKFLIYPKFQLGLIAVNVIALVATVGFIWFQFVRSFQAIEQLGKDAKLAPEHVFFKFQQFQYEHIASYLLISLGVAFVCSTLFILYFSHRVAGPLVRLKKELQGVADSGKFKPFRFREKDYFSELPELLGKAFHAAGANVVLDDDSQNGSKADEGADKSAA